jgi:hypothetical protein
VPKQTSALTPSAVEVQADGGVRLQAKRDFNNFEQSPLKRH